MTAPATLALTDFLMARFVDDEADAPGIHELDCDLVRNGVVDPRFGWTCTCGRPARVLAECDAKRRIGVAHAGGEHGCPDDDGAAWAANWRSPCATLCLLALPYADHPDYREEWRG